MKPDTPKDLVRLARKVDDLIIRHNALQDSFKNLGVEMKCRKDKQSKSRFYNKSI